MKVVVTFYKGRRGAHRLRRQVRGGLEWGGLEQTLPHSALSSAL